MTEIERLRAALETAERGAEDIRLTLIDRLAEPERTAFWKAVNIRDGVREALAALRAPAEGVGGGWLPIESAPKDGTEIWAFNGTQQRMKWIEGDGYELWVDAEEVLSEVDPEPDQPTHWRPLPAAPTTTRED